MATSYTVAPITTTGHEAAKAESQRTGKKLYSVIGDAVVQVYGAASKQKKQHSKKEAAV